METMSTYQKLVYSQCLEKENYVEYRLAELIKWLMTTRHTPLEVKVDIRKFYEHYLKFMQFDTENYGVKCTFVNEKMIFVHEKSNECWATVELKSFKKGMIQNMKQSSGPSQDH